MSEVVPTDTTDTTPDTTPDARIVEIQTRLVAVNLPGNVRPYKGGFNAFIGRQYLSRHKTEREAWEAIAAFHRLDTTSSSGADTLFAYGPGWFDEREKSGLVRCVDRERSIWNMHIATSALVNMPYRKVQPIHIQQWVGWMQKKEAVAAVTVGRKHGEERRTEYRPTGRPLSVKAIRNGRGLLRQIFVQLMIEGKITSNPVTDDIIVKSRATVVENDNDTWTYLTPAEIEALFTAIRSNRRGRRTQVEKTIAIFAVAIFCGLRAGEIFGLRWRDVHLDAEVPYIEVRCTWSGKPVKTDKSRRTVYLLPRVRDELVEWKATVDLARLASNSRKPRDLNELVFPSPHGGAYAEGYDAEWADTWRSAAGIRECVVFHSMRHTCASMLRMGGPGFPKLDLEEIAVWLGHSSTSVTQRYVHLDPSLLRDPVAKLYTFKLNAANADHD